MSLFLLLSLIKRGYFIISMIVASQMGLELDTMPNDQQPTTDHLNQQFFPLIVNNPCNCYYVDSVNGSDANPGTSEDKPWKSLVPVHSMQFLPGSVVNFKRGSTWSDGLYINSSGVDGNPILFTIYGEGKRPTFENPGDGSTWASAIFIDADWVIIEDILAINTHNVGVYIANGSDYNIVKNIEATNVGFGISIYGQHNLVSNNYIHDLHIVNNTPGGNDDYGAVGIVIANSHNEISYNKMINCIAPSFDYGVDGGAVEWWSNADNNYVHHNWASGNDGFLEVGGGSVNNSIVSYNVSVNNGGFSTFHLDGKYKSEIQNFRIENNTIVENENNGSKGTVINFGGEIEKNTFFIRNNIFSMNGFWEISNKDKFIHNNNIYYLDSETNLGFPLNSGEVIANPLFVRPILGNFQLMTSSLAIDNGVNLGYTLDFNDHPVPAGVNPDIGAYESQSP